MDYGIINEQLETNIPCKSLEEIFIHSSVNTLDKNIVAKNKTYSEWGKAIIKASYVFHLYHDDEVQTANTISRLLLGVRGEIANKFHEAYDLEKYVVKTVGEQNKIHTDTVYKLVALIYQYHGFKKVYNLLSSTFDYVGKIDNTDYKSIVIEYATSIGVNPTYSILSTQGPDHQKIYECELIIGKRSVIASAIGKKNAEKAASKLFATKYNLRANKTDVVRKKVNQKKITDRRKKDLSKAFSIFKLNGSKFTYRQLDEVLTHSSYVFEHPNQGHYNNEAIRTVGSYFMWIICFEYVINNYDLGYVETSKECSQILNEKSLIAEFPKEIYKYVLLGNGFNSYEQFKPLIPNVIQGLVGYLLYNYMEKDDIQTYNVAKTFIYDLFDKASRNKWVNYTSFILELVQSKGWKYQDSYSPIITDKNNNTEVSATATISGDNWTEIGSAKSSNKKTAINFASKDVLPLLINHLEDDDYNKELILRMTDPEVRCAYEMLKVKKNNLKEGTSINTEINNNNRNEVPIKNTIPTDIQFIEKGYILYVCKSTRACIDKGHIVKAVTGIINSIQHSKIKINTCYCADCNLCYISLKQYKDYKVVYGPLFGNLCFKDSIDSSVENKYMMNEESLLHQLGYTVSKSSNLTENQRRNLLIKIMDSHVMEKPIIIEYLEFFINFSKSRSVMKDANKKWTSDLNWLREYNLDNQNSYQINEIKKYNNTTKT